MNSSKINQLELNPPSGNRPASDPQEEMYRENILDHFRNPHNYGLLKSASVHRRELNPLCGDEIEIALHLAGQKVKEVRFQGQGCAISIASASLLTDYLKCRSVKEIMKISSKTVLELLGIPISSSRIRCALLALKTVQGCLEEYNAAQK